MPAEDKMELKMTDEKKFSKQLIGKTVISKTGKRFGEVGDIVFETKSGEIIHLVLVNPTTYIEKLELEKDNEGNEYLYSSHVAPVRAANEAREKEGRRE